MEEEKNLPFVGMTLKRVLVEGGRESFGIRADGVVFEFDGRGGFARVCITADGHIGKSGGLADVCITWVEGSNT